MVAAVIVGVFGLVVGLWLTIGTTESLISSLTSDYEWNDKPSPLTFALWYVVDALRIIGGMALVTTGVLLFVKIGAARVTAVIGGALPLLTYAVWVVNNLQSMEERDELVDQLFWWAGTAWGITCLVAATLVFLPPVTRTFRKKPGNPAQSYTAPGIR